MAGIGSVVGIRSSPYLAGAWTVLISMLALRRGLLVADARAAMQGGGEHLRMSVARARAQARLPRWPAGEPQAERASPYIDGKDQRP